MVDIVEKVKDFFDGEPEVKRDDDGVYVVVGGEEYRAPTLGDLEAELRRIGSELREQGGSVLFESEQIPAEEVDVSDAVRPNPSPGLHEIDKALAAVQNERQRQQGVP